MYWVLCLFLIATVQSCTVDDLKSCMVHLKVQPPPGHIFISVGEPEFTQMCKDLNDFEDCIDPFLSSCDASHTSMVHDVMNRIHYVCTEGKDVYLKHYTCFGGDELNKKAYGCITALRNHTANLARIINPNIDTTHERQQLCSHLEDASACMGDQVEKFCGSEAADLERKVMGHHLNPAMAFGGCSPTAVTSAPAQKCSEARIRECQSKHILIAKPKEGQMFLSSGDPEFSTMCRELEGFESCLAPFRDSCDDLNQRLLHQELNRIDYMCKEDKEMYMKHHQCFGGDSVNDEAKTCAQTFTQQLEVLSGLWRSSAKEDQKTVSKVYCSSWDKLKDCIYEAVEKHCGKEAAEFEVNGVMGHHYNLSKFIGGCPSGSGSMWIIVGCVLGLFVILLAVGGALGAKKYMKRKKSSPTSENTFDNPLENAYDIEKY